jgi:hypothetical protein
VCSAGWGAPPPPPPPPKKTFAGPLRLPLCSWLLCESLIHWAREWAAGDVSAAAKLVEGRILEAVTAGGLQAQAYWLGGSLATGALLKMRTIGRKEFGQLLRLGDELIVFGGLQEVLGDSVADMLPVNVAVSGGLIWWCQGVEEEKRVSKMPEHACWPPIIKTPMHPGPIV